MENIGDYLNMKWDIKKFNKINVKNPYLIEGLPGMGNVGKIAIDFIIENLKAKKIMEIYSYSFPHCVFVNEKNLVELPSIKVYQKKLSNKSFLLIAGDIQPLDEASCYEFCNLVLDTFKQHKIKEIITLGGIGQHQIPKTPKIFCTGNDKKIIKKYAKNKVSNDIYGVVGPIIGVSGLLIGTAGQRNIPAIALLAETYGHPSYLGIKGAKELLKILNTTFSLKLKLDAIVEMESIEKDIKNKKVSTVLPLKNIKKASKDINYIG